MEIKLTKEDVWGTWSKDYKLINRGMIVAQGYPSTLDKSPAGAAELFDRIKVGDICPVWNDKLPYKSVTVICNADQVNDVIHWLSYVHGGEYSMSKELGNGKVAFRSDYQCW